MNPAPRLTPLQLSVMKVLWDRGEAAAADVHRALADERELAPTTVATLLARLARQGLVRFRKEGRVHLYRAAVGEEEARDGVLEELTEHYFEGDAAELVSHLLRSRDIAPGDLARVKELIAAREREEEKRSRKKRSRRR